MSTAYAEKPKVADSQSAIGVKSLRSWFEDETVARAAAEGSALRRSLLAAET